MGELKQKTVNGVAWNTINTVSTLAVQFIVGIILARILLPSDYGAVAMVTVFTSILTMFTDGGLTTAIIRKENRTEEDKCTIFYYNIVASYAMYGLLYVVAPFIADFYDLPSLCSLTRISTLGLLIAPFTSIQALHFTINLDFKTPAYINIFCAVASAIIAIWMAYNGFGVYALAVPTVLATALRVIIVIWIVRWWPTTGFSMTSFKELFGYSSKLLASWMLDRIYNNITPLIVGKFFSAAQLGLYERARGWPKIPSETLTGVLQSVTFPVLSKMQHDTQYLAFNYRRIIRLAAFVIFPLLVGLAATARPLTIILVTEKWLDSVLLMQLICLTVMWYPIHAINLNLLTVTGRSDYFLKVEVIKKVWGLIVMCAALPFGLVAFCAAGIASAYVSLFINTWYTKEIIGYGFKEQLRDLLPFLFNNLAMGAICLLVQMPFESNGIKLLVGIPVAVAYYIISSSYVHKEQFNELLEILASKIKINHHTIR